MKIVFIVGSLEPGRDGVGDYTRRLAAELVRQGQDVRILALNDKVSSQKSETENHISDFAGQQSSEGTAVKCLRLPMTLPWPERVALAREWVDGFGPDWVSLQFVPFAFHLKGLCFGLGKKISAIAPDAKWHIMFHELWLGLGENASWKHRLWGMLQRSIIRELMTRLKPCVVHTQAEPYQKVLECEGITAGLLPLFSNVPLVAGNGWKEILEPLTVETTGQVSAREEFYLAGVFSAVHPEWNVEDAVNLISPLIQRTNKRLALVFFGRSGLSSTTFDRMKAALRTQAVIVVVGEQSVANISKILQTLDLGLATSPRQLIQKSSSIAAMLEHGLPVLVTRNDWRLRGEKAQPTDRLARLLSPKLFAELGTLPTRDIIHMQECGVRLVANKLLQKLTKKQSWGV